MFCRVRIRDNKIGLLNPQNKPYVPVSGWPVMELDDLVLNAMADQLDPKVGPTCHLLLRLR